MVTLPQFSSTQACVTPRSAFENQVGCRATPLAHIFSLFLLRPIALQCLTTKMNARPQVDQSGSVVEKRTCAHTDHTLRTITPLSSRGPMATTTMTSSTILGLRRRIQSLLLGNRLFFQSKKATREENTLRCNSQCECDISSRAAFLSPSLYKYTYTLHLEDCNAAHSIQTQSPFPRHCQHQPRE